MLHFFRSFFTSDLDVLYFFNMSNSFAVVYTVIVQLYEIVEIFYDRLLANFLSLAIFAHV